MKVWAVPLLTTELSPRSLTLGYRLQYSEFDWITWGKPHDNPFSALPLQVVNPRLARKLFREEPAITKLV